MKSLNEIILERKSIREFEKKPIEKSKLLEILEAGRLAPSACNGQPWKYIVVENEELKNKIVDEGMGIVVPNKWAKTAPVIIVVCSKTKLFIHKIAEKIQDVDYHLIDIGISCQQLVLKACELGIGSCYIGWFSGKKIKKILNLKSDYKVECLIVLGYPTPEQKNKSAVIKKTIEEIAEFR